MALARFTAVSLVAGLTNYLFSVLPLPSIGSAHPKRAQRVIVAHQWRSHRSRPNRLDLFHVPRQSHSGRSTGAGHRSAASLLPVPARCRRVANRPTQQRIY